MAVPRIKAETREDTGSISAKHARREGKIPAVIYGAGEETKNVLVPVKDLEKIIEQHGENTLATVDLGRKKLQTYMQEVQRNVVTQDLLHVDFHHLIAGKKVKIKIPISVYNQEDLMKEEILIRQRLNNLEVNCMPQDIIEKIELDAEEIQMDKPVTVADLELPESIEPLHDPEEVVAMAYSSHYEEEEIEEEELEEEELAEPVYDTGVDEEESGEEEEE